MLWGTDPMPGCMEQERWTGLGVEKRGRVYPGPSKKMSLSFADLGAGGRTWVQEGAPDFS